MKLSLEQLKSLVKDSRLDFRGQNIVGVCPRCGHNEFGVSIQENHFFGCYRLKQCGFKGNIYSLLKELGRLEEFRDFNGYSRTEELLLLKKITEEVENIEEVEEVKLPIGFKRVYKHSYLEERGFTEQDYLKYKVGVTNLETRLYNYIIFPVEYEGKNVGYVGRSQLSKSEIKLLNDLYTQTGVGKKVLRYINSTTNFGNLVYGIDEITENTKIVIVVEGIFDKINVDRQLSLFESKSEIVCIGTFKCKISPQQYFLVKDRGKSIEDWWLFYDPDVLQSIFDTGQFLLQRGEKKVSVIPNMFEEYDPGAMDLLQMESCIEKTISSEEFYRSNIIKKELK